MISPDLSEASRLLHAGMRLVRLVDYTKRPVGDNWNDEATFARFIDPSATGYGLPLTPNHMASVDPDNWRLAVIGMRALGFDLNALMDTGVRTKSTRTNSGGRAMFRAEGEIRWKRFASKATGTVLELRAHSPNLQDVIPGVVYDDRKTGQRCTQQYVNGRRLDELPEMPDDLFEWWEKISVDLDFLREQERLFFEAIEQDLGEPVHALRAVSIERKDGTRKLAYASPLRGDFNRGRMVDTILKRHGYEHFPTLDRWAPPTATGAPGVRPIPGKDDLWHSDHASCALFGTFDAWSAFVQLDHNGDKEAAERAFQSERVATSHDLPALPTSDQPSETKPYRVEIAGEFDVPRDVPYHIKHFWERGAFALTWGPSGGGKSYVTADMVLHLTSGRPWCGHRVNRAGVVYFAAEGVDSMKRRFKAMAEHAGLEFGAQPLAILSGALHMTQDADGILRAVADAVAQLREKFGIVDAVLVVDTLARSAAGMDENSNMDMGIYVGTVDRIRHTLGMCVVTIHHGGKDLSRGPRGAYALHAAADCELLIADHQIGIEKLRDGPTDGKIGFQLHQLDLGMDSDGDPLTACHVEYLGVELPKPVRPKLTPTEQIAFDALKEAIRTAGEALPETSVQPLNKPACDLETWRRAFYAKTTDRAEDAQQKAFTRAKDKLLASKLIGCQESRIWIW